MGWHGGRQGEPWRPSRIGSGVGDDRRPRRANVAATPLLAPMALTASSPATIACPLSTSEVTTAAMEVAIARTTLATGEMTLTVARSLASWEMRWRTLLPSTRRRMTTTTATMESTARTHTLRPRRTYQKAVGPAAPVGGERKALSGVVGNNLGKDILREYRSRMEQDRRARVEVMATITSRLTEQEDEGVLRMAGRRTLLAIGAARA